MAFNQYKGYIPLHDSSIGSTVSCRGETHRYTLYAYIDRHAGTPEAETKVWVQLNFGTLGTWSDGYNSTSRNANCQLEGAK